MINMTRNDGGGERLPPGHNFSKKESFSGEKVKYIRPLHDSMNSIPRNHIKLPGIVAWAYDPRARETERGGSLGLSQPTSLGSVVV